MLDQHGTLADTFEGSSERVYLSHPSKIEHKNEIFKVYLEPEFQQLIIVRSIELPVFQTSFHLLFKIYFVHFTPTSLITGRNING
jgi:hypothetical protein